MIKEFNNLSRVDEIVKKAHEKRRELAVDHFRRHLIESMIKNDSYIKIDTIGDEVVGFMFATIQEYAGQQVAFIQEAFTTEQGKTSLRDLLDDLEQWAIERQLEGMCFVTGRNPKAWRRKYKFERVATIMSRRIKCHS